MCPLLSVVRGGREREFAQCCCFPLSLLVFPAPLSLAPFFLFVLAPPVLLVCGALACVFGACSTCIPPPLSSFFLSVPLPLFPASSSYHSRPKQLSGVRLVLAVSMSSLFCPSSSPPLGSCLNKEQQTHATSARNECNAKRPCTLFPACVRACVRPLPALLSLRVRPLLSHPHPQSASSM